LTAEACRVRIDLSYDGGGFSGWARQPGQRTVQQVLEDALSLVLRADAPGHLPVRLTVAGRTDAGVHARGQVAHADLPRAAWLDVAPVIVRRLAGLLPADVRVRQIAVAPDGFDARFSALSRRYSYRVCDDVTGPEPLRRHDTLWSRRGLEIGPMNEAARLLLGEHDFAAFCRRREGATTVRELLSLSWSRPEPTAPGSGVPGSAGPGSPVPGSPVPGSTVPGPRLAEATVIADAFCHSMVRALVGALLKVGEGARPPSWPAQVLTGRVRDPAVPVVPPHGLCLEEVCYPLPGQLAQRALATRRVRPAPAGPSPD
jgi:tRNA pseudouridine38-40 synthase